MFRTVASVFVLTALLGSPAALEAAPIWGTDASFELTGFRTSAVAGGVTATAAWASGSFSIAWFVTDNLDGTWTYQYTVNVNSKDVSHLLLEVTNDGDPVNVLPGSDVVVAPTTYSPSDPGNSNPNLPNPLYAVKFDFGGNPVVYTIVTDRAPVYGVFYTKDGKDGGVDVTAWANALNFADYQTNLLLTSNDFIVRPNGAAPPHVPEPGTLLLAGIGLAAFGALRRRKR